MRRCLRNACGVPAVLLLVGALIAGLGAAMAASAACRFNSSAFMSALVSVDSVLGRRRYHSLACRGHSGGGFPRCAVH